MEKMKTKRGKSLKKEKVNLVRRRTGRRQKRRNKRKGHKAKTLKIGTEIKVRILKEEERTMKQKRHKTKRVGKKRRQEIMKGRAVPAPLV